MMTAAEILLVQDSFRKIARIAPQTAALFYARLFELDPTQQSSFSANPHERGSNLMVSMAVAISSLETSGAAAAAVHGPGSPQGDVDPAYAQLTTAGAALFWTLQNCLGSDFTPALRAAWARIGWSLGDALTEIPQATRDPRS